MRVDVDQDYLESGGTAGTDISPPPSIIETQTVVAELIEEAGLLRTQVRHLNQQTQELHQRGLFHEWDVRTTDWARKRLRDMLDALADNGFAWREIARMVGVSIPALQKWRRGEGATGENRQRVASLLGACDLIASKYCINETASWFETPLRLGVPVTPIDLWSAGRRDLVFDHASGHADAELILTSWDPQWRERYRSEFEVFRAGDGELSIRPKER